MPFNQPPSGDLVSRYRRGEHTAVWQALRAHGSLTGDLRAEALAVARETMQRVARGADLLAGRLSARGWQAYSGCLRTSPMAADASIVSAIEKVTAAPLPPSMRVFWEVVGGIDFVWNYQRGTTAPDLGVGLAMAEMDPLAVDPPAAATELFEMWDERRRGGELDVARFNLDLAADYLHKADISGGRPYGIELPFVGADPMFVNEEHGLAFVDYLRLCFRWAGFPRLERYAERADVVAFVGEMTKDVEPF